MSDYHMVLSRNRAIQSIAGFEPKREGEYPRRFTVGMPLIYFDKPKIERILYRQDSHGDHSPGWFDVYVEGERFPVASMAERAVAEIFWETSNVG